MFKIWAVAKNTIAQAVRIKIVSVVILLLLVLLPLMSRIMIGDNTLHGKLQTFISYGMSLTSLLLCVVTIVISCYSLTSDLKGKEIYLVVTKPIRRFQVVCGKLLGVIILDVFLLAIFAGLIYGLTMMMPKMSKATAEEMAKVDREFFTAREGITDPVDEDQLKQMVMTAYRKLEEDGELPVSMSRGRVLTQLREQAMVALQYVEVNTAKMWEFENLRPLDKGETLFIRYKHEVLNDPVDMKIHSQWQIGDVRQLKYGADEWQTPLYPEYRTDIVDIFNEFEVPADAIAKDGYLAVAFHNPGINNVTVIPREVEVLYRAGTF
ncbi:MAG: ABC transporter permease, partial [Planctomycetes bacterium]|nr:ABC transporter permease [Planctomycetota bacterium]